jgi:hypothetical protein
MFESHQRLWTMVSVSRAALSLSEGNLGRSKNIAYSPKLSHVALVVLWPTLEKRAEE